MLCACVKRNGMICVYKKEWGCCVRGMGVLCACTKRNGVMRVCTKRNRRCYAHGQRGMGSALKMAK